MITLIVGAVIAVAVFAYVLHRWPSKTQAVVDSAAVPVNQAVDQAKAAVDSAKK